MWSVLVGEVKDQIDEGFAAAEPRPANTDLTFRDEKTTTSFRCAGGVLKMSPRLQCDGVIVSKPRRCVALQCV